MTLQVSYKSRVVSDYFIIEQYPNGDVNIYDNVFGVRGEWLMTVTGDIGVDRFERAKWIVQMIEDSYLRRMGK